VPTAEAISGLAHNLEAGALQQAGDALTQQYVVVGHDDPRRLHGLIIAGCLEALKRQVGAERGAASHGAVHDDPATERLEAVGETDQP
jgi:hypothetical protein